MTMRGGGGNLEDIGVNLVVIGLRAYQAALKQAEAAAREFARAQALAADPTGRTRPQQPNARTVEEVAVARATAARLNAIEDLRRFNATQARLMAQGAEALRPMQRALREEKRLTEELLQTRQKLAQELKNRRADEALDRRESSKLARDRQAEGQRFAEMEAARRADARRDAEAERALQKERRDFDRQFNREAAAFAREQRSARADPFAADRRREVQQFNELAAARRQDAAEATRRQRELSQAARAQERDARAVARATREQRDAFADLNPHMRASVFYTQQVGAGFITMRGNAGALALVLATLAHEASGLVRTAIQVESAFARVNSVMGLSPQHFGAVRQGLRDMAQEVPFTVEQLGEIATEVSRAGVSGVDNILKMTRAMADFTATSDVAATDSVRAFATIMLALREPPERIRALTSAVSELDRQLPTTQGKIIDLTQRIAGAGAATGFTTEQLFAIAAAVTSTGIQAEAGGTAIQRVFFAIAAAVDGGGETLAKYAVISNQTAEQFKADWESDPAKAFTRFVQGIAESGDQAAAVLKELELGDVRLIRTMVTTGGILDKLAVAFRTSDRAASEATATQERAALIYATTASQVTVLENKLRDQAIELGTVLLPAYQSFLSLIVNNVLPVLGGFVDFLTQEAIPGITATADAAGTILAGALDDLGESLGFLAGPADLALRGITLLGNYLLQELRVAVLAPLQAIRDLANLLVLTGRGAVVAFNGLTLLSAILPGIAPDVTRQRLQDFADALDEMNEARDRLTDGHAEWERTLDRMNKKTAEGTTLARQRADTDREALSLTRLTTEALNANLAGREAAIATYREEQAQLSLVGGDHTERIKQLDAEIARQEALVKVTREELAERAQQQRTTPSALGDPNRFRDFADEAEKAKTELQKLGVGADQARKFLESLGLSTEEVDGALLSMGASANELGESIDGMGISTAQAIRLMQAAGLSAEEIAAKLNEIRLERWNKELEEAAQKSREALKAIADRVEELTGGLLDELVPALELAAAAVGEDFTGALRGAGMVTTVALTNALMQQAALIGGPYASALIAVAKVLGEASLASADWQGTTEDMALSAEAAVVALTQQAEAALELAKVNGDTEAALSGMAAAVAQLGTMFERLPEEQRKVAHHLLDGVAALIAHAQAAGADEAALAILFKGLEALTAGLGDYVDAVDEAIEADRKRAEEAQTAEEKLVAARSKEERATASLVAANERLLKARQDLADARKTGDADAIRSAGIEVGLARDAVQRAKDRVKTAKEERGEAEVEVAEKSAATEEEGVIAGEIVAESVAERAAREKRERLRRQVASVVTPGSTETTVPIPVGALPGADRLPAPVEGTQAPAASLSRNVTVNATYVTQPEVTVRHDLEALSMVGLV